MEKLSEIQLKTLTSMAKKAKEDKYNEDSKKRLSIILKKKLETSFIGALAAFEKEFGFLWGFEGDKPLTKQQKEMGAIWDDVRTQVLNNGNNQLRAIQNELSQYTIKWNRYQMTLLVKEK